MTRDKETQKLYNAYRYAKELNPEYIEVFNKFCKQRGLNRSKEMLKAMRYYMDFKLKVEKAEEKILKEEEQKLKQLL